ncbi:MAG: response regulator transcription factor [Lachnospiraceae bacterium]|nr:response regulator transcription factor [Lachnospiraceae bacterium]
MSKKILIADDETRLLKLLSDYLTREGYMVVTAEDGEAALEIFYKDKSIEMAILDVMMPGVDGYTVCREIRETSDMPIIILTAKSEENDVLNGFDCGADEFVSKPFSPKIFVARVNALYKRIYSDVKENEKIEMGGIMLDKQAHQVMVDDKEIVLSVKEFELLAYFMENADIALSRDKILNGVWEYDYFGDARTIDTHVKKLRAKLGEKGNCIKTIWGMGYKFEV